jgi:hypothetical protein
MECHLAGYRESEPQVEFDGMMECQENHYRPYSARPFRPPSSRILLVLSRGRRQTSGTFILFGRDVHAGILHPTRARALRIAHSLTEARCARSESLHAPLGLFLFARLPP